MRPEIPSLIKEFKYRDAFWAAAQDVMTDNESKLYFLRIVNTISFLVHLDEDIDAIKADADEGNPYMKLAYARLHDYLQYYSNSLNECIDYYEQAANEGLADAWAHLAQLYASGRMGEKYIDKYHELIEKAMERGSYRAIEMKTYDLIYGRYNVVKNPQKAQETLERYIKECEEKGIDIPYLGKFYQILGDAYQALGDKEKAAENYQRSIELGNNGGFYDLAIVKYYDYDDGITDADKFEELMNMGEDAGDPRAYYFIVFFISPNIYDQLGDDSKKEAKKEYFRQLELAKYYGEGYAAYLLGEIYERGLYDTEVDYEKAFSEYARGGLYNSDFCLEAMARMILKDKTSPAQYDKDFGYECAYFAMLYGADTLDWVIKGYKSGYLTAHAAAIEMKYLPEYEKKHGYNDDNDVDDSFDIDDDDNEIEKNKEDGIEEALEDLYPGLCNKNAPEGMTLDDGIEQLEKIIERSEEILRERECTCELTEISKEYIRLACWLSGYTHLVNKLYSLNKKMLDMIADHPRLKLKLLHIQLDVLHDIEVQSNAPYGLSITQDVRYEISTYENCIALADKGELDKIPQSGSLKKDPVEWTHKWERIIDDADSEAYANLEGMPKGMGWCHGFWHERAAALSKRGLEWKSPALMNPKVLFD